MRSKKMGSHPSPWSRRKRGISECRAGCHAFAARFREQRLCKTTAKACGTAGTPRGRPEGRASRHAFAVSLHVRYSCTVAAKAWHPRDLTDLTNNHEKAKVRKHESMQEVFFRLFVLSTFRDKKLN